MVYLIIAVTCIVSILGFRDSNIFYKLLFSPYQTLKRGQYYRILTHAFLHANTTHLLINMLVLWSFGGVLIAYFGWFFEIDGGILFLLFYLSAAIFSSLYSLLKHKNNPYYSAIGASGATSAVVYASIFFDPWHKVLFFGVLPIPGIIFGVIYLVYEYIMGKQAKDNIGHDAHFWGAVYGFCFPLLLKPELWKHFSMKICG